MGNQKPPSKTPDGARPDMSGQTVTVKDASLLFDEAGVPRNQRSIRRYCKRGDLECAKVDTEHGSRYLIERESLEKYIIQLQQARDQKRPDMSGSGRSSPALTGLDRTSNSEAPSDSIVEFLKRQIDEKDKQINALLERDRETNILIQGLQQMVLALQAPNREQDTSRHVREHEGV